MSAEMSRCSPGATAQRLPYRLSRRPHPQQRDVSRPSPPWLALQPASGAAGSLGEDPLQKRLIRWERILGPRQITDACRLALVVAHGGRLVSLDQRLDPRQVPGAGASHLCVMAAHGADAG